MAQEKPIVFVRRASGLVRELGMTEIALFLMATIIGASIFLFAPQGAVAFPGSNIPLAYVIVGITVLPFVACVGLTLSAIPRSGGLYTIISRTLHPTVGYMAGWLAAIALGTTVGLVSYVAAIVGGAGFARVGIATTPNMMTTFAIIMVLIAWGVNVAGIRLVRWVIRFLVLIPFVVLMGASIYLFILGPSAVAHFDAVYGTNAMANILSEAGKAGWAFPAFSLGATFGAFLAVIYAYQGTEACAYLGGEMRTGGRRIFWGLLGGMLAIVCVYVIFSSACFYAFGDGIAAYTFLQNTAPETLGGIMTPVAASLPFFMISVFKSGWLAFAIAMGIMLWPINSALVLFTEATRSVFALSFDRTIPGVFSDVNRRGAPTVAGYLVVAIAIGAVFLMRYEFGPMLGILTILWFMLYWMFGLSATIGPYVRPDIYERVPTKSKGLIVGLGLYSFILGGFYFLLAAKALDLPMIVAYLVVLAVGFGLYLYQQGINRKKGLEILDIYREVPPD